jgi:dolichyl-phosphate beta-glucosyltransferase
MLSIVIPAYNEEQRLPRTLRAVAAYVARGRRRAEIIVVDDGSTDGTSAVTLALASTVPAVRLIRLARNGGKGLAVRTGVVNAAGQTILFCDADGATPIEELSRLETGLAAGADVAIGSRGLRSVETRVTRRLSRHLAGRTFHQLVKRLAVPDIVDTQCGFKLFRAAAAHSLFARSRMDGFSFDVEILLLARRLGYRAVEVPVNWTHQPGSRINVVLDGLRMARDVFRIRANAVRGLYDGEMIPAPGVVERLQTIASAGRWIPGSQQQAERPRSTSMRGFHSVSTPLTPPMLLMIYC